DDSAAATHILRRISGLEAPVLDGAELTHLVLTRPYRTPFTLLLTFIGHSPIVSLGTVPFRAFRKKFKHANDIPTIGYLQQLHVGILADAMERATVIASGGERRALVFMAPFSASKPVATNVDAIRELEALAGVSNADRRAGWSIAIVAQVGQAVPKERIDIPNSTCRILGANLMAFRSERIQPGVNQEPKAPAPYQVRQDMDVPDELTVMAGRAAYNAFTHWTGCDRDRSKELFLLERVDVLSPHGKRRLREIRSHLGEVTDQVVQRLPKWIDWPTGRFLSKSAEKGRKAFALAGQRIYIVGLSKREIAQDDMDWDLAVRATGAACSRGALVAEIMGATDIPEGCDLLAGICLMAGPVNQNDIGKSFYGAKDLLAGAFPDRDPTSLLVWTLKAKTVADPIGNEEQLMNPKRKGALVDLRLGPHEAVFIRKQGVITPFRKRDDQVSEARAFAEIGNFVVDSHGKGVPGNEGTDWPFANESVW
ncbi:MAG: hypothetical protein GWP91_10930, partial [Rhodobacterales bacterium]|nr:hypothetical protein [Rhodobacterales bacterium]